MLFYPFIQSADTHFSFLFLSPVVVAPDASEVMQWQQNNIDVGTTLMTTAAQRGDFVPYHMAERRYRDSDDDGDEKEIDLSRAR